MRFKTYGYHRTGVLAAFVNALTLVALSLDLWRAWSGCSTRAGDEVS